MPDREIRETEKQRREKTGKREGVERREKAGKTEGVGDKNHPCEKVSE